MGTWKYQGSAVVFESENVLASLGGTLASSAVESKINSALNKVGMTAGVVTLTLNEDKTYSMKLKSTTITGTWTVSGTTLTLTPSVIGQLTSKAAVSFNVALNGNTLQLSTKADKILDVLNGASSLASKLSSSLGTITSLLGNYNGVQLGLKFTR